MTTMKEKFGFKTNDGLQFGLYSLGDYAPNPHTNQGVGEQKRIQELIETAQHAEQAGLDIFALGESHQEHFVSQAHAIILGAIAQATSKIKLSSSSTVVSTSDPVRIYENFATLDLISDGRVELVGGRASRIGLFELLGYELRDYEELFEEKFELLNYINQQLEKGEKISWEGQFRHRLNQAEIFPKPKDNFIPIWRGVGGSPASAVKAGRAGIPMVLTTLAGPAMAFYSAVEAYHEELANLGIDPTTYPLTTASPMYIAPTGQEALAEFYPHVKSSFLHSNGSIFPKQQFAQARSVQDTMMAGSPEMIVDKLIYQYEVYGMDRYIGQIDMGGVPIDKIKRTIDLLGEKVIPEVKKYTKKN
ncbi:LLM class flavin-dependent oxidoreductase [Aerococcus viridans]|uniref:LLM class flavin-dependent oxidoreductase n=1 Tax=Aerococcus viridans TaxID=1377 RepID=UPI003B20F246